MAAAGMALTVAAACFIGETAQQGDGEIKRAQIQPDAQSIAWASRNNLFLPENSLSADVAIATVRRQVLMIEAGMTASVTLAQAPITLDAPDAALGSAPDDEPLSSTTIRATDERILGKVYRSAGGDAIYVANAALVEQALPSTSGSVASLAAGPSDDPAKNSVDAFLNLAEEAHARHGAPAMSVQAMSEYLSLHVLRDRAAAVGKSLQQDDAVDVGGFWSANLSEGLDAALAPDGQERFGSVIGFDAAEPDVLEDGGTLVYGGFASAFGAALKDEAPWLVERVETRGASLGLFAVLDTGALNVSAMVRADFSETTQQRSADEIDFSSAMRSIKAEVVARYRTDFDDWFLEPSLSVNYVQGVRESDSRFQPLQTEEAQSLRAQLGVTAGSVVYNRSGLSVEPSVTIRLSQELIGSGEVTYLSGAPTGGAEPVQGRTVGSVSLNVDVIDAGNGITGFVKADGQVSDDDKASAGVSAGVRAKW